MLSGRKRPVLKSVDRFPLFCLFLYKSYLFRKNLTIIPFKLTSSLTYDNLSRFICECAKVAKARGYKVIGIQYYAECWASKTYPSGSLRRAKQKRCLAGNFHRCRKNGADRLCTGKRWTNFVYILNEVRIHTYLSH